MYIANAMIFCLGINKVPNNIPQFVQFCGTFYGKTITSSGLSFNIVILIYIFRCVVYDSYIII